MKVLPAKSNWHLSRSARARPEAQMSISRTGCMNLVGNSDEKTSTECDEKTRSEWAQKCHTCKRYLIQRHKINYRHYFDETCTNMACFSPLLDRIYQKPEGGKKYRGIKQAETFVREKLKSTKVPELLRELLALKEVIEMLKSTKNVAKSQSLAGLPTVDVTNTPAKPPSHTDRSQGLNAQTIVQPRKRRSRAIVAPIRVYNRLFNQISLLDNEGSFTASVCKFDSHGLRYGASHIKWYDGFEMKLEVECGVEPSFLPGIFFTPLSVFSRSKTAVDEKKHRVLLCNTYQGWEDKNGARLGTWGFITCTGDGVKCILRSTKSSPRPGSGLAFTFGSDADNFEAAVVGCWPMKLSNDNLSASFHRNVNGNYDWYAQVWDIGRKVIDYSGLSKQRKRLRQVPSTDFKALYKSIDDEGASHVSEQSQSADLQDQLLFSHDSSAAIAAFISDLELCEPGPQTGRINVIFPTTY